MSKKHERPFGALPLYVKSRFLNTLLSPLRDLIPKKHGCPPWVSPPKKRVLLMALLLILANAIDALLTQYGVSKGLFQEINLVPQFLLTKDSWVLVTVKVFGSGCVAALLYWRTVTRQRYAWYALLGLTAIFSLLCAYLIGIIVYAHYVLQIPF